MAKITESLIVIKVSKMVRDNADTSPPLDADFIAQLEAIILELTGGDALVEIETHNG